MHFINAILTLMNSAFVGYEELSRSRRVLSTEAEFVLIETHKFGTLAIVIFKAPYTHEHDTLVLPDTRMIEGGNSKYHDLLEELFIPQNIADLKVIRYKVFTFDLGFKISGDFTTPGSFIFLDSRICAC